jgi:hypothetical protein
VHNDLFLLERNGDYSRCFGPPPEAGRSTSGYYDERKAVPPSAPAQDDLAAERLWVEREALVAEINIARLNVARTDA